MHAERRVTRWSQHAVALLAVGVISGCQSVDMPTASATPPRTPARVAMPNLQVAAAGLPVQQKGGGMADLAKLASEKQFGTRADVFALLPVESQFRAAQTAARLVVQAGGFQPLLGQIQLDPPPPVIEPLPVWRLAGVVLGDGVVALLDTGDGRVYDVRPGSRVPGTPWTVVAIDSERAVLRREGNRLPREFIVYLSGPIRLPTQAAPGGQGQQGQQPGAGGQQGGGGGRPGGTPQT